MYKRRVTGCLLMLVLMSVISSGCGELYFEVINGKTETLTNAINKDWRRSENTPEPEKTPLPDVSPEAGILITDISESGFVPGDYGAEEPVIFEKVKGTGYMSVPPLNLSVYRENVTAKGLYITANTAGIAESFNSRVEFCKSNGMNALVIDVKDENGYVTFKNNIEFAGEAGISVNYISDIDKIVSTLKESNIYSIARIVVFKDKAIADIRPDFLITMDDGSGYWESVSKGEPQFCWLDPYNRNVWEYVTDIAVEAAKLGFDEIQFDYISFPTDSNIKNADFSFYGEERPSYTEIITEFSEYAVSRLKPYGVKVSADVFAAVIISDSDAALVGQDFIELAKIYDIISPMVYPSHFANKTLGISVPDSNPYDILNKFFKVMNEKIDAYGTEQPELAVVRPWLQDFTAVWLKGYKTYGAKEVNSQIKACYDNGITQWLLWDASNKYNGAAGGGVH